MLAECERAHPEAATELMEYAEAKVPGSDEFTKVERMGFYRMCVKNQIEESKKLAGAA